MNGKLPKVVEITIFYKQQLRNNTIHMLCLGMHVNVMLRSMVQALQDLPLCSSTDSSSFSTLMFILIFNFKLLRFTPCPVPG